MRSFPDSRHNLLTHNKVHIKFEPVVADSPHQVPLGHPQPLGRYIGIDHKVLFAY
jgi:hypothetical protein